MTSINCELLLADAIDFLHLLTISVNPHTIILKSLGWTKFTSGCANLLDKVRLPID